MLWYSFILIFPLRLKTYSHTLAYPERKKTNFLNVLFLEKAGPPEGTQRNASTRARNVSLLL